MELYHGSNTAVVRPKLVQQFRMLDFGSGFYTTFAEKDDIFLTFTLYEAGELTKEETISRLKIKKLFNQMVLSSERAISFIRFIRTLDEKELSGWN